MKLVFATNNRNKLQEVQDMLPANIELLTLEEIGCLEDIAETETTLEGNAKLKADHVTDGYSYNCFADDTGLEVWALDGQPGVYSARYAGPMKDANKNMNKLLLELNGKSDRSAQFRTAVALNLDGKQFLFEGVCKGEIITDKTGNGGFGYDPIFKPEGYNNTFAEMPSSEKNVISHRGIAIQKLVKFLSEYTSIKKE